MAVEEDTTTFISDIVTAGENKVIWALFRNKIRRYISLDDYIYPDHKGRVGVRTDQNTSTYKMVIKNPKINDSGTYECGYERTLLEKNVQFGTLFVPYLELSGKRVPKRVLYMFKNLKMFRI